jgi:hypothetical protein
MIKEKIIISNQRLIDRNIKGKEVSKQGASPK